MYLGRAKEKRKNRDKRIGMGPAPLRGSCEEGKVSTHEEAPSWAETTGGGGKLQSHRGECSNRVQKAKWRDYRTEDRCQPALTCRGGRGLGVEARTSEIRSQGEDWGWLHEHSLKGASAPQLAGRESGKNSGHT